MTTTIYVYSGTGNSLWAARALAAKLPDARVESIARASGASPRTDSDTVGIVFPVHIWGLPPRVVELASRLEVPAGAYLFAVAVNAGQVARTLIQLRELLEKRGLKLAAGESLVMPSNYIPWGGPGPKRQQEARFEQARAKLDELAARVARREPGRIEAGPLWQRLALTAAYKATYSHLGKMDRDFWTDERCNGCGICARICPAANVVLASGKPQWQRRCEQCFACLQWCPREAVQYGKKTPRYQRYHHPEITVGDIIELAGGKERAVEAGA